MKNLMKLVCASAKLWAAFNVLTRASRGLSKMEAAIGVIPHMEAALGFTIQLAIDADKLDDDKAAVLGRSLTTKLSTWCDKNGDLTLVLWTHDMCCVVEALTRMASRQVVGKIVLVP